jgi:hypothetical protein
VYCLRPSLQKHVGTQYHVSGLALYVHHTTPPTRLWLHLDGLCAGLTSSALHDPVAIVHIPTSSAPDFATKLYWTIERAPVESSEFFNVTSNCIEVGVLPSSSFT